MDKICIIQIVFGLMHSPTETIPAGAAIELRKKTFKDPAQLLHRSDWCVIIIFGGDLMKTKLFPAFMLICGSLLLGFGFALPVLALLHYPEQGNVGIIGGADLPTYGFLFTRFLNGVPICTVLLGGFFIAAAIFLFRVGDPMKAVHVLPAHYGLIFSLDLQKNKKIALLVNGLAILIGIAMAVPMHFVVPLWTLFDMRNGLGAYAVRFAALMGLMVVYMVLHELVHGITMKIFGTKKVKYGFTGIYAFAGSEDYYPKGSYIAIALAPVVVWGIVLAIVNTLVDPSWFWVIYLLQISNISGAAGDLFVTWKFAKLPKDILVKDSGVAMQVFSGEQDCPRVQN